MEIRLSPELFEVYREIQAFYIDNDALPTVKTLAKIMSISNAKANRHMKALRDKKVLTINSQKGYMWVRCRQVVKGA